MSVRIDNASPSTISLDHVVVDLLDSVGAPTDPMSDSPARAFAGTLAAGHSSSGVYVFTIDARHRKPITVQLSYTSAAPVVVFAGNAS